MSNNKYSNKNDLTLNQIEFLSFCEGSNGTDDVYVQNPARTKPE